MVIFLTSGILSLEHESQSIEFFNKTLIFEEKKHILMTTNPL